MLAHRSPHEAYRRVDFDARVSGASPTELVHLCYEHLVGALGTAIHAHGIGDNSLKSSSMTRALSAITALQLGVSGDSDVASALKHLYESARRTILDSALEFEPGRIEALRADFVEISHALLGG